MAVLRLYEPGETPVIRGHVEHATVALYRGSRVIVSGVIDPKQYPVQTNNVSAWLRAAYRLLGRNVTCVTSLPPNHLGLLVNNGEGALHGRGSNLNVFKVYSKDEYGVAIDSLVFTITTIPHARRSLLKKARGEPMNKRRDWSRLTYYYPKENVVYVYLEEHKIQQTWDAEEYFAQYPHHRGQIETRIY